MVPIKFGPHGQMVPWSPSTNGPQPIWYPYFRISIACPPGQTEYSRDHLARGIEFLGTICPWVLGTELVGDCLSRGTNRGGPNIQGPYAFGTKYVTAFLWCLQ